MTFPWTRFQDFYLRLGFLKALVLVTDPGRRSVSNEALVRRLRQVLFGPASEVPALWSKVEDAVPWLVEEVSEKKRTIPTVAEALLLAGRCPSFLFALTPKTAYKVVDWGRDIGLLGPGNQATESSLLLRALIDHRRAQAFLAGDLDGWNPFVLTNQERIFFLLLATERDHLTIDIAASMVDEENYLEARDAGELTCRLLFDLLDRWREAVPTSELPDLRSARDLACTMAYELSIPELEKRCSGFQRTKLPSRRLPPRVAGKAAQRKRTKNTDHQTVPRFEQLVDLGLLKKPAPSPDSGTREGFRARKRWRYLPTARCQSLARSGWPPSDLHRPWAWDNLAKAAIAAGFTDETPTASTPSTRQIMECLWAAYETVKRQVGHTPAYSVAVLATIRAAARGITIEISDIHRLLLEIKKKNLAPEHAFFASGNEVDKMFVLLRPGLVETVAHENRRSGGAF